MRCLFVSDLHYVLKRFDWLVEASRHVDLVTIGDGPLDVAGTVDLSVQTAVIMQYLQRLQMQADFVFGDDMDASSREPFDRGRVRCAQQRQGVPSQRQPGSGYTDCACCFW